MDGERLEKGAPFGVVVALGLFAVSKEHQQLSASYCCRLSVRESSLDGAFCLGDIMSFEEEPCAPCCEILFEQKVLFAVGSSRKRCKIGHFLCELVLLIGAATQVGLSVNSAHAFRPALAFAAGTLTADEPEMDE